MFKKLFGFGKSKKSSPSDISGAPHKKEGHSSTSKSGHTDAPRSSSHTTGHTARPSHSAGHTARPSHSSSTGDRAGRAAPASHHTASRAGGSRFGGAPRPYSDRAPAKSGDRDNAPGEYTSRGSFGGGNRYGSGSGRPSSGSRFGGGRSSGGSSGGSRMGGRNGGFGGGNRGSYGRTRNSGAMMVGKIDVSRFINKAPVIEVADEYVPDHHFSDFDIHPKLKENIAKKGYISTTPIQDKAIPHVLEGKDVVGIANTGTGKTAAFLIPLINKAFNNRSEKILILVPTRELAVQIQDEYDGFAKGSGLRAVTCIGGANIVAQMRDLRGPHSFVIGTPGRIKDLIERRRLNLSEFHNLVLDEADRMVDMGFIQDIKYLLSLMPADRQSLFFSATISKEISALIHGFLKTPVTVSVKMRDTAANVDQDIVRVTKTNKLEKLCELLNQPGFDRVLIFGKTKRGVEKLMLALQKLNYKAESIHGDKPQSKRQRALDAFKKGHVRILIATDVAARGIDVNDVSHVINFDIPQTYEDYIHRIGRTGRANKKGFALTFVEL